MQTASGEYLFDIETYKGWLEEFDAKQDNP
jgi:hypothetical protein